MIREIEEADALLQTIRDAVERISQAEPPALDDDGNLQDPQLEAIIARHERQTGHSVDRSDGGVIMAILIAEMPSIEENRNDRASELEEMEVQIREREERLGIEQSNRTPRSSRDNLIADQYDDHEAKHQKSEITLESFDF